MAKLSDRERSMKKERRNASGTVHRHSFRADLLTRRTIHLELPKFVIFALEQRVSEANTSTLAEEAATLNDYVESELANLITLRDVAELESLAPGFASAVQAWLNGMEP